MVASIIYQLKILIFVINLSRKENKQKKTFKAVEKEFRKVLSFHQFYYELF